MRRLLHVILVAGLVATSTAAAADEPRAPMRYAWNLGIEFAPVLVLTAGLTVSATRRFGVAVRVGTLLLSYAAEIEARLSVLTGAWSPYLYVGAAAFKRLDPEQSEVLAGPFAGIGVEVSRHTGHFVAGYAGPYLLDSGAATRSLCWGGGLSLGRRW